ncbi:MAG TPA: hypothetical protein VEF06_04260 [Bryobacteraceae bacterium]|nr:hypothetical protein [Bryobacteraceae bacterium]
MTDRKSFLRIWTALAAVTAILVVYSQTLSLTWDEGFHLVAAQLIRAGKKPYVDFLFAQTPLNAYWNALWFSLAGQTWHTAHALAALESAGAVALTTDYLLRRFPLPEWRFTVALASVFLVGLNVVVVEYGTLGQAYGLCLLLIVLAFRFTVARWNGWCGLAGLAAGAAASSSLLTFPVAPVLLLWILWRKRSGAIPFLLGAAVALIPMLRLFLAAPHQVIFDVMDYHLFYRQAQWDNWFSHDLEVLVSWLDCFHALVLGVLALIGAASLRRNGWDPDVRREFILAGWLAVALGAYLMTAHPTFQRYFLLMTPFTAILAAAGIPVLAAKIGLSAGARWPVLLLAILMSASLARDMHEDRDDNWYNIEPIARKVDEVTAPGAMLYADEHVYFLTGRIPPTGLEWNGAHKVDLPMDKAGPLHILPRAELVRRVKAGVYATVETCGQGEPADLGLDAVYRQHAEVKDCFVYWDRRP